MLCTLLMLLTTVSMNDVYEWRQIPQTEQVGLLRNGRQVGCWHTIDGYYRSLKSDGTWGPCKDTPPISPPIANFGLMEDQISPHNRYRLNGKDITRQQVEERFGKALIPDLAGKWRLTVIGAENVRTSMLKDFTSRANFARWKDHLIVAAYAPDHWHVARVGFRTTGTPTIYLQDSRGVVLHRQDDYVGGAESLLKALDNAIEKRRTPDPNYDPTKDPDARKEPSPMVLNVPWSVWVLLGGAVLILSLGRRKV